MIKNLFVIVLAVFFTISFHSVSVASHGHGHHHHRPRPPSYPYPQPYQVTCYTQGLGNGAVFYGVGPDVYTAQRWALYVCQASGQYCQYLGCRNF